MQIRVANRQDEPAIRNIVNEARAENGEPAIDLTGADSDLNNIEAHYFWYDGIFLVAEEDGTIVGLIGARRGNDEHTLELLRLAVSPHFRKRGVARLLIDHVLFFARNLEYRSISMVPATHHLELSRPVHPFVQNPDDPKSWITTL